MVRVAVVLPAELEAVTVKVAVAVAAVGVPLMIPVRAPKPDPAGRAGLTRKELGAPPMLVGLFAGIGVPTV
jgi:hypothetical protein